MTPNLTDAIVSAQDDSSARWPEEASATDVIGLGRASLNARGMALLPCGAARDTSGMWTRSWSVQHAAGAWTWSVQSTDADDTLALARAYRDVLGMPVRLDSEPQPERLPAPAPWAKRPGDSHNNGKRPFYMPVERPRKSAEQIADEFARMQADADEVFGGGTSSDAHECSVVGCDGTHSDDENNGREAGANPLEPTLPPVLAADALSAALSRAEGPDGREADGASSPAPDTLPDTAPPLIFHPGTSAGAEATSPALPPAEAPASEKPAGKARHRWLGGDVCVRCGESKGSASGECSGKKVEAVVAVESKQAEPSDACRAFVESVLEQFPGFGSRSDESGGDW